MKDPITIVKGGRSWLVWDPKLFHIAFDLASEGAAAIARASGISRYSSVAGFTSLEPDQRTVVVNDARRIHAIIKAQKGSA